MFSLRHSQQQVYNFAGGKMGVSAVPGSGKTYTLSCLAARLIGEGHLIDDQEVLIVTLVNSAVNNFEQRLATFLKQEYNMLPRIGYRVRTLHGLANDIVRERPDLCGLPVDFQIMDERETTSAMEDAGKAWLRAHPEFIDQWANPDFPLAAGNRDPWGDLIVRTAGSFIRQAKDLQLMPEMIRARLAQLARPLPLLEMGCEIFENYQKALNYRSAVDFDDLIRLALRALKTDPDLLDQLHYRWPFILEDEAQDSSRLQEQILRLLVGETGGWVRVGDPNQAIYETFTTADPRFLRNFMVEPGVTPVALPTSGRSTSSIISLANYLIDWVCDEHPVMELRDSLTTPKIKETEAGDSQRNPADNPDGIRLMATKYDPDKELQDVVRSLQRWLPDHPDDTVAVLVPRNERGAKIAAELRAKGLEVVELLRNSLPTREIARILGSVLRYLDDPANRGKLVQVFEDVYRKDLANPDTRDLIKAGETLLKTITRVEDYLRPTPMTNWLLSLDPAATPEDVIQLLADFRTIVNRWQDATLLPIDQLILTIGLDLFADPPSLALAHKLALVLERDSAANPDWHLPRFASELEKISRSQRKVLGFTDEDTGFDPDKHKGKVVVATIHKAKGLEWDRVYLLSVNNYDFPSAQSYDSYISERRFVINRLNLEAEILAQLKALAEGDNIGAQLEFGPATVDARLSYSAERLRLLYVGMTRAKKELIVTWNTGQNGDCQPAVPFLALQAFWEEQNRDRAA